VNGTYVIDTSALMQAYVEDAFTEHAKALLDSLAEEEPPDLHLLDIQLAEAANVLWKRVYLRRTLELGRAHHALRNLLGLPLIVHESSPLLPEALTLGANNGMAVYDVLVIALAQEIGCPLITADQKQARIAEQVGVTVKPIADFAPAE
jgi:predicted nucleic acid-binding protein